jgi:hypothetical protein
MGGVVTARRRRDAMPGRTFVDTARLLVTIQLALRR